MAARTLPSLMTHFPSLQDPRLQRTRKHNLLDSIALTIGALISGADSGVAVEKQGKAKLSWLQGFLQLPHGIASHHTIGRFFAALSPEKFRACFAAWVAEGAECLGLKPIAIEGKTQRRSQDRGKGKAALHRIRAWAVGNHLIRGQEAVDQKSNDITAIAKLLALLDLEGALVTIDAMGCPRDIAEQIVEQKGDQLLTGKENQPTLDAEIERLEEVALANDYAGASDCCTQERSHGRQEWRAGWVLTDVEELQQRVGGPGLQRVIVVVGDRTVGEQNSCEKHYYISSRKLRAETFVQAVRGHWGIENALHWVLDVVFAEEGSRVRTDHGPDNFGLLRRMALSMLKAEPRPGSIQVKRRMAGWENSFMEKILLNFKGN